MTSASACGWRPVFCDVPEAGNHPAALPAGHMTVRAIEPCSRRSCCVRGWTTTPSRWLHGERTWTWREHLAEAAAEASALIALADPARPVHVGALLGNSPAMLRSMAAAALGGYVLCGINTTRRGDGLLPTSGGRTASCCSSTPSTCLCSKGLDLAVHDGARRRRSRATRSGGRGADRLCRIAKCEGADTVHDDLHVGHQRRPESGAVRPRDGGAVRRKPGRAVRDSPPTTSAICRCRCSTPTGWRRAGRSRLACRGDDGAREVLAVAVPGRHPPLRRHLHELRRQAAGAGAGHAGEARRRRQHVAGGVRKRGHRARRRRVRRTIRLPGRRQLRLQRVRRRRHARRRLPAGIDRQGISRSEPSTTPTP